MALRTEMVTEHGAVAQALLTTRYDENEVYDTIVIGSGMGGGVVASALADEKKRVLVLEAGSLLFPTHVGNLPRRLMIGKFQKHIWSLWDRFNVRNYNNVQNSTYNGAQGFNLGGRSIFWGSSIPPLADWELQVWPKAVRDFLLDGSDQGGYALARGVFNADIPQLRTFHYNAVKQLSGLLGNDWEVAPAPVAVEYSGATEWSVPAGVFSTADLLLEDALADELQSMQPGRQPLTVNLNHAAHYITFDPDNLKRATGVHCYDMLNRVERTYRAKSVVICAGTLESAKIALRSNIDNRLIGQGIVDHPIYYRHFVMPPAAVAKLAAKATDGTNGTNGTGPNGLVQPANPLRLEAQSTKLLVRHTSATMKDHAFDIVIELGANFNQGRFVDEDHLQDELRSSNGFLLCEIVFQFYSPLMEQNYVRLGSNNSATPVNVYMERYQVPQAVLQEAREVAGKILKSLEAESVMNEDALLAADGLPDLKEADVGGVAHEVGTLRMPVNGQRGVVDENLKFEGYENVFACDNSVFPCSPCGNPSLTLVALARRCAKYVAKLV